MYIEQKEPTTLKPGSLGRNGMSRGNQPRNQRHVYEEEDGIKIAPFPLWKASRPEDRTEHRIPPDQNLNTPPHATTSGYH